jgi:hypothetical protein
MPRLEKRARIYGMPTNLAGKIYPTFSKNIHVIPGIEDMPEGAYTIDHVLDPHDRKPWAIAWIAIHSTGSAYVIDEYPDRNFNEMLYDDKTYDDYVRVIKQKEEVIKSVFREDILRRIIDPNFGNKTIQLAERQGGQSRTTPKEELRKRGLSYRDGIDALEAGHISVREWLYWQGKEGEIVTQPKVFVLSHCQNMIRHLSRYSRKDIETADGDEKDNAKPKEKYKDFADLIRYWAMSNPAYVKIEKYKPEIRKAY